MHACLRLPHCRRSIGTRTSSCSLLVSCTTSAVPGAGRTHSTESTSKERLHQFFNAPPHACLTLERSIRPNKLDSTLWDSHHFSAEVFPDLPLIANWQDIQNAKWFAGAPPAVAEQLDTPATAADQRWLVRTVGVQTMRVAQLRGAILRRAGLDPEGQLLEGVRPPDALLMVSGSHLFRRVPGLSSWFSDSVACLQEAVQLREEGLVPPSTALWCVENPLLHRAPRLNRKVDAGAQVVLTQPPLLWDKFERWMEEVHRDQLDQQIRIVVGIPMLSSSQNAAFWLQLCQAGGLRGAGPLLQHFRAVEADGKEEAAQFFRQYNRDVIQKVLSFDGVAGLHVMPLTALARTMTLELLKDNVIGKEL